MKLEQVAVAADLKVPVGKVPGKQLLYSLCGDLVDFLFNVVGDFLKGYDPELKHIATAMVRPVTGGKICAHTEQPGSSFIGRCPARRPCRMKPIVAPILVLEVIINLIEKLFERIEKAL